MKNLEVYLNDRHIGVLHLQSGVEMRFAYDKSYLESPDSFPLSRSLPLKSVMFSHRKTRSFFSGVLPEGEIRNIIAGQLGISSDNDFILLEKIGGECAGALSLFPEEKFPAEPSSRPMHPLTDDELVEVINEMRIRPLMAGRKNLRLSLAGAQNKLPVIFDGEAIFLPLDNTPSTHILKPESERFPDIAINEIFCMKLAESAGINVPETRYLEIGGKSVVLVKRYDRVTSSDATTLRIHQEDFCQALGYPPEVKYQQEGGPTVAESLTLLKSWSSAPVLDIPRFLDVLLFNVIIGNADAHGKNFSFLYHKNIRRLAPFYDLVSTVYWEELSKTAAMKIGGATSINAFNIGDWKKMAGKSEISWPMFRERLNKLVTLLPHKLNKLSEELLSHNSEAVRQLHSIFLKRIEKMSAALSGFKNMV